MTATSSLGESMRSLRDSLPARSNDDSVVAGVCGGIAAAFGIDSTMVRVATVVLAVAGPGLPLYLVAWLVLRVGPDGDTAVLERSITGRQRRVAGLALVVVGTVLLARQWGLAPPDAVVWPVILVGLGFGVLVWQSDTGSFGGRRDALRIAAGVVVVGAGTTAFIAGNVSFGAVRDGVVAIALVVAGLGLILGPFVAVLVRDRRAERSRRLQADARADMAAHLHDSVLQSLAMIQRTDDPREMSTLARQQERELRQWLYGDPVESDAATVKAAVERATAAVEDLHGVVVETVVVGDGDLDHRTEALVAATGEAVTNAAKWSGQDRISVFVEVEPDEVNAYVRDTGVGFDPDAVAEDRLGVKESILGRMHRAGGSAEITSSPGNGTEVHLHIER